MASERAIALATDHVRPSRKPETWNIGGFITVWVILGLAMVAETLLLLFSCLVVNDAGQHKGGRPTHRSVTVLHGIPGHDP